MSASQSTLCYCDSLPIERGKRWNWPGLQVGAVPIGHTLRLVARNLSRKRHGVEVICQALANSCGDWRSYGLQSPCCIRRTFHLLVTTGAGRVLRGALSSPGRDPESPPTTTGSRRFVGLFAEEMVAAMDAGPAYVNPYHPVCAHR